MPYRDPDSEDPLALNAVGFADPQGDSLRAMAECIAEDFLRVGHEPGRVISLFESPHYVLAHRAFQVLGPAEIRAIVEGMAAVWCPTRRVASES